MEPMGTPRTPGLNPAQTRNQESLYYTVLPEV